MSYSPSLVWRMHRLEWGTPPRKVLDLRQDKTHKTYIFIMTWYVLLSCVSPARGPT
jgi:hypothetical protein